MELDLRVITPFDLKIEEGSTIQFDALLPQLGAKNGMLVTTDVSKVSDKLVTLGYGYSVVNVHSEKSVFNLEGYKEVFSDWGWSSTASEKPDWMD